MFNDCHASHGKVINMFHVSVRGDHFMLCHVVVGRDTDF